MIYDSTGVELFTRAKLVSLRSACVRGPAQVGRVAKHVLAPAGFAALHLVEPAKHLLAKAAGGGRRGRAAQPHSSTTATTAEKQRSKRRERNSRLCPCVFVSNLAHQRSPSCALQTADAVTSAF